MVRLKPVNTGRSCAHDTSSSASLKLQRLSDLPELARGGEAFDRREIQGREGSAEERRRGGLGRAWCVLLADGGCWRRPPWACSPRSARPCSLVSPTRRGGREERPEGPQRSLRVALGLRGRRAAQPRRGRRGRQRARQRLICRRLGSTVRAERRRRSGVAVHGHPAGHLGGEEEHRRLRDGHGTMADGVAAGRRTGGLQVGGRDLRALQHAHLARLRERRAKSQQHLLVQAWQLLLPNPPHSVLHVLQDLQVCAVAAELLEGLYKAPREDAVLPRHALAIDEPRDLHFQRRLPMPGCRIAEGDGRGPRHPLPRWQSPLPRVLDLHHLLEAWSGLGRTRTLLLPHLTVMLAKIQLVLVYLESADAAKPQAADELAIQGTSDVHHSGGVVAIHEHRGTAVARHAHEDVMNVAGQDDCVVAVATVDEVRGQHSLLEAFVLVALDVVDLDAIAREGEKQYVTGSRVTHEPLQPL
mmetsp:Transcript_92031/g.297887  ORF Transcript_92031/g.297887 Transcript_92031/m.297887 type:complete len:471 (-) Transcript_92031:290-1702(-)